MPTLDDFRIYRAFDLQLKVMMAQTRIREFYRMVGDVAVWSDGEPASEALVHLTGTVCESPKVITTGQISQADGLIYPYIVRNDEDYLSGWWLESGCNILDADPPRCIAFAYWTFDDVADYINTYMRGG